MTNHKRSGSFLGMMDNVYVEMNRALSGGAWNLALRRAQEVVELGLKGLILLLGGDYPRIHDAAQGFADLIRERNLDVTEATLSEIRALSRELEQKRAPAFYSEIEVTESQAQHAADGATLVLDLARRLWDELGPQRD